MTFQDQVIWITGASSGLGAALAIAFSQEGAKLILSSRRADAMQAVKEKCSGDPGNIAVLPLDLADLDAMRALAAQAKAHFGRIDILVNNGGVGQRGSAIDINIHVVERIMRVNFLGQVALTQAVLPYMIEQKSGNIVVISSLQGELPVPGRTVYAASKHALHGFFESLRAEVWKYNIKVTIIAPGLIKTEFAVNAVTADGTPRGKNETRHENAMPADIAAQKILAAVRQGKEIVYIGGPERFAIYAKRFAPGLYSRFLHRVKLSS